MTDLKEERYQWGEVIGKGGMATVYRGFDRVSEMAVAMKVLHPHLSDDPVAREGLIREAELLQRLDHPSILRSQGIIEVEGRPVMVMDLHEGGDLRRGLSRKGSFNEEEAMEIILPLLEALEHAHHRGVLHRDIKPQNILFAEDGRPVLIDFGIGVDAEGMEGGQNTQLGTVEYMAPERFDGLAIDGRSDLYSLGITFFEMVCGHVPYRADSPAEVVRMHRDQEVADPALFNPSLSAGTRRALRRVLARHPEERFDRAAEFKEVLEKGEHFQKRLGLHQRWKLLREDLDRELAMTRGGSGDEEWVVLLSGGEHWFNNLADFQRRAAREVIEAYREYGAEEYFQQDREKSAIEELTEVVASAHGAYTTVMHRGFARGLSREGARRVVDLMKEKALPAIAVKRVALPWKKNLARIAALALVTTVAAAVAMTMAVGSNSFAMAALVAAPLFAIGAVATGSIFGMANIDGGPGGARRALVETHFLLDFRKKTSEEDSGALVGSAEVDLVEEIRSPRVQASLERVMSDILHLQDLLRDRGLQEGGRLRSLVDEVRESGRKIQEHETTLGLLDPGKIVRDIEGLDRRIEREEDLSRLEGWIAQKEALRRELEVRDQAQQRLEAQAQELLERASELEKILHSRDLKALQEL